MYQLGYYHNMRFCYFLISLYSLFISNAFARPIVVAVIDSGFAYTQESLAEKHLCKYGHKDFTEEQRWAKYLDTVDKVPLDLVSHGTQMVGIIDKFAGKKTKYCFVIIKVFNRNGMENDSIPTQKAFRYATSIKADIINFSGGGIVFNELEYKEVISYLANGGIFVSAAGNNGENLDEIGHTFYPAMYDKRIKVVGNLNQDGTRNPFSNYGKVVKYWEVGTDVKAFGTTGSGSSQATATKTGKIVRKLRK